ncbi:low molecular weight phosphatase family protein [Methanoculleus sediminis]|uniref:hypothetical protein n=1 Tax=Methanoculleus sediminis TaxID=1550566 RepID=UPI00069CB918|nr:hypothetical protein [Methanoculleus sediminis]
MKKKVLFVCTHRSARPQVVEGGICPFFPRVKGEIHREFPDPLNLAGTDDEIMADVRRIRDEVTIRIDTAFGAV